MITNVNVEVIGNDKNSEINNIIYNRFKTSYALHFPLRPYKITFNIEKLPIAYANGIRRCMIDEIPHNALLLTQFESDDEFINIEYFEHRIGLIPIRPLFRQTELELTLNIVASNQDQVIYTKNLKSSLALSVPLFNPGTPIIVLRAGKSLTATIKIETNIGRFDSKHSVGHLIGLTALDLKTHQRPNHNMQNTNIETQHLAAKSRYVESSLLTCPQKHQITAYFDACPDKLLPTQIVNFAIQHLIGRFESIIDDINKKTIGFLVLTDSKGILSIPNETATIQYILYDELMQMKTEVVKGQCIAHKKKLVMIIQNADPQKLLLEAINNIIAKLKKLNL